MPTTFDFIEDAKPATTQFDFQPDEIAERPERTRLIRAPLPNLPPESRKVLQEMSQQPLVNIPAEVFIPPWTQMVGPTVAKSAQAMGEETAAAASGFTSPLNLGLLAATKVAPQMGIAIAASMIPQITEGIQETVRGIRAGDIPASVRGATKTALTGTMAVLGGLAPFHTKLLPRATAEAAREGVPVVESEPSVVAPTPTVPVEIPPKIAAVEQAARRAEIKAARPVVPETPPETERGLTVLEEIRAKGADTKAKIQALYPQLSRETASKLRDQAFPREKIPDNLSRQDVDRLFLDKLNEESNREIEQATAAPKPTPLTPAEQSEARADLATEMGEEPQAPVAPEPAPSPETPPVSAPEAKAPVSIPESEVAAIATGDKIRWEPNENERRYQGPVEGTVVDVISNTEGEKGYHVSVPLEGDPGNVVRVWANRGKVVSRQPAQVEPSTVRMPESPSAGVGEGRTPNRPKTVVEIADEIAARGVDPQASYGQFVKARNLKPEIDAKEWLPIYRQSLELANLKRKAEMGRRNVEPTPPAKVEAPAAKPAAETPVGKQPWQMTFKEYEAQLPPEQRGVVNQPLNRSNHKEIVQQALMRRETVPDEVLRDYPALTRMMTGKEAPKARHAAETGKETPVSPSGAIEARPEMEGGVSKSLTGKPWSVPWADGRARAWFKTKESADEFYRQKAREGDVDGPPTQEVEPTQGVKYADEKYPPKSEQERTIIELEDQLKSIKQQRREVRAKYKGVRPVSTMNRTTPNIERGQAFQRELDNLEMEETGVSRQLQQLKQQTKPPETPPTGPGISNGPGAAGYGTPGTYSPISALTDQMATSPVKNLREAIGIGERLSDAWAQGKDTLNRALGKLRVVPGALKRSWKGIRELTEVEERVAANDWVLQQSSAKSKQAGEAIRQAIPASQVRDGMAIWIDAAGDEAAIRDTLANLPPGTKPRVRRSLEAALNLPDEVKTHATNLSDYYARRAEEAQSEEVLTNVLEDYFTHVWKKPANMPDSVKGALNSGRINEYFKYARHRKLPTFLEGILQGKEPVLDPAEVIPHYNYLMDRAIASRRFIKSLEESKMPDGKPVLGPWGTRAVIGDPGEGAILIKLRGKPEDYNSYRQIDHPALRKWKWAATDEEGRPVFYEGTLAVHPEAYERLARIMDRSRLTSGKITRALLRVSGEVKGAKLGLLSPFHQVHLGTHALGHWTLPFGKMPTIDWDAPSTRFAVEKAGLKLAPNPAELANFAEGILSPGLVHKIPLIGPLSKAYSEWLFTDYLPRLKLKTFENAWTRNRAFYDKAIRSGKVTEEQLAMRVGDSINNAYGELNQLWLGKHGRDPRVQRALRLGFLAPDFGEARLRFIGKAVKPYSLEERLALGTLFATLYVGARVGNILSHGDPEIEDWKHAFAVKAGDHWYSMRSVLGDTLHAFSNFPNFLYVRLNPAYARGIMEFFTGRDITGRRRTAGEQVLDELKQIVPIHLGGLTRDDQHIWESFSTAIGLGTQRAAPTAEVSQLAGEWRKKRGIETRAETLSDPNSPYRKARIALEFGNRQDFHAAIRELTKQHQLRGDRTPRATIKRAFEQYYTRPFSGSARLEPAFKASLGTREQRKYRDALIERGRLLRQFRQWY